MAISEKTINSPEFIWASNIANDSLQAAVKNAGFDVKDLYDFDTHAGRVVDELAMLLLRIHKKKWEN